MEELNEQIDDTISYFKDTELWISISKVIVEIFIILIVGYIVIKVGTRMINRTFNNRKKIALRISERREQTLRKLLENTLVYTVYLIVIMTILQSLGVKVGALLAGAGVAGLAIGFGAQSLVKDIISGFFIVFEDQFSVGDYVSVSEAEGTVEEIGLRTTKIQGFTGERYIIPNGNITEVINYSIHNGLAVVDINVPYETDKVIVEQKIEGIIQDLPNKCDFFKEVPVIYGVQTLDVSHYVIRVVGETLPANQWAGARAIRKEIKEQFYKDGIDIPAPRLVMYSRNKETEHEKVGDE